MPPDADALRQALGRALSELLGAPAEASGMRQLAGGASKEIWSVDLEVAAGPRAGARRLVLVRQLGGKIKPDALDLPAEHAALAAAFAAGVPAPEPFALLPDLLGRPAALAARLDGETIGRRIVREPALAEARRLLPAQAGAALARIHAAPLTPELRAALPAPPPGLAPAEAGVAAVEADLDRIEEPHPAMELCLRWLRRHTPPPPARLTLVHGDFRLGNWVVGPSGLAGVLDWEFARIGDPHEDLAWPLVRDWRFGADELRFAGVGQPEAFFAAYAAAGGPAPDPRAVRFWEVLGNMRWAAGCLSQAERHLSGQEPNLEFASLGRRAAEMELEGLALIAEEVERAG